MTLTRREVVAAALRGRRIFAHPRRRARRPAATGRYGLSFSQKGMSSSSGSPKPPPPPSSYDGVAAEAWADGASKSPPRDPSIWKFSQTISVRYFFSPVWRSSQERVWSRPSRKICLPLVRYWPAISACLPQTTIWCHSVCSWRWPLLSFQRRLVARVKLATGCPEGVDRTSGSRPRLPIRITLLTIVPFSSGLESVTVSQPSRRPGRRADGRGRNFLRPYINGKNAFHLSTSFLGVGEGGGRGGRRDRLRPAGLRRRRARGRSREGARGGREAGRPARLRGRSRQDEPRPRRGGGSLPGGLAVHPRGLARQGAPPVVRPRRAPRGGAAAGRSAGGGPARPWLPRRDRPLPRAHGGGPGQRRAGDAVRGVLISPSPGEGGREGVGRGGWGVRALVQRDG